MKIRNKSMYMGLFIVVALVSVSYGVGSYLSDFNTQYGTSGTALDSCKLCHPGGTPPAVNEYGADYLNNGYSYTAIESLDSDGDGYTNIEEINAGTWPGNASSKPGSGGDSIPPTITGFSIPASSNSLIVPVDIFTATDDIAVAGYKITKNATKPAATGSWSPTPPTKVTLSSPGNIKLYGWAKDTSGNVSLSATATVTVTLNDTAKPVITSFTAPATSSTLDVPITSFTATDDSVVAGYMVTKTPIAPGWTSKKWSDTPPTSISYKRPGSKTFYGWVRDGAGKVSKKVKVKVTITLP